MAGDDIKTCETASGEKDPLTSKDWAGDFIGLEEAHQVNRGTFKDSGDPVIIAIIDSGVEATRTDVFGDRILEGWDVYDPTKNGGCDGYFHGTGVAAIAAGTSQGEQFVGVAPEAEIIPMRAFVSDEGADFGKSNMVASLIDDAVANGASVINISIALPDTDPLEAAVKRAIEANVVIVAATGNGTLNMDLTDLPADKATYYPANYPEVIAVGAHNQAGNWYPKTNYGEHLDLVAPGDGVVIPYPGGGWVSQQSGTSFASPYVAGAAALLKAQYGKDITPSWVEHRLKETAIHPPGAPSIYLGQGVLNVAGALTTPLGDEDPFALWAAPDEDESGGSEEVPQSEPSSIAAINVDYDPLAFEKTIAWASVGGSLLLVTLVLVLRKIVPKGRKRGWRPGTRKPDNLPVKLASD
ncbi:S8 family peptidase [Glycomyces paridis]|nr:S8 family serine peptidase [Glycomyces paridis]